MGETLARNGCGIKPVNFAAFFGLDFLVEELISNDSKDIVNSHDGFVGNLLHWGHPWGASNDSQLGLVSSGHGHDS